MLWRDKRESDNVEDRRGISGGKFVAGGGLGTLLLIILALLFGVDPRTILQQQMPRDSPTSTSQRSRSASPQEEELKKFVSVVLAKTEDVWTDLFRKNGSQYRYPKLVL